MGKDKRAKQLRRTAMSLAGVAAAAAAVAVAAWLLGARVSVPGVSSLPFGLFVFAGVALLLAADGLLPLLERCAPRSPAPPRAATQSLPWHAHSVEDCAKHVGAPAMYSDGLTSAAAAAALHAHGENRLQYAFTSSLWRALLKEVHEPQQTLLLGVAVLYALVGEIDEAGLALAVIALMVLAEVITEFRAKRALASLQSAAPQFARVLRNGAAVNIQREFVVPGDVCLIKAGFEVPGDARIISSSQLEVNESRLTGEAVPVHKSSTGVALEETTPLAERSNLVFAGTVATRGRGLALVVATGLKSELGTVLATVRSQKAREKRTALQVLLKTVASQLTYVALLGSLLGGLLGLTKSLPWQQIVLIILSLAFATIPEELPILIAAVLAVGAQALGRRNVFVKRLRAMEALAFVDTVLTDKTGTMTANKLRMTGAIITGIDATPAAFKSEPDATDLQPLLAAWAVMAEEQLQGVGRSSSDPFDAAVLAACPSAASTQGGSALLHDSPFDSATKISARAVKAASQESAVVCMKGAPEAVLARCSGVRQAGGEVALDDAQRDAIRREIDAAAGRGYRMVGYAQGALGDAEGGYASAIAGASLVFLGVLCFEDPLRPEVNAVVAECAAAGVKLIMVTGDHPDAAAATAARAGMIPSAHHANAVVNCGVAAAAAPVDSISLTVHTSAAPSPAPAPAPAAAADADDGPPAWAIAAAGDDHTRVFARAVPAHKLQLAQAYQRAGHTVAVTGDGVNDAPALAAADVGIAVQDATDVAREACAMVVVDGDFSALALALKEGRRLYDNLVHALAFYLGAKLGILALFIAGTIWNGFPLAPVQVIVLELYMDLGASMAFVAEPAEAGIMQRPPRRPGARFFDGIMIARIAAGGASMAACVLGGYGWGLNRSNGDTRVAQSMGFVCWLIGHILLAVNQRTAVQPVLIAKSLTGNIAFLSWVLSVVVLAILVGLVPGLDVAIALVTLEARDWGVAVGVCAAATFWIEAVKLGYLAVSRVTTHASAHQAQQQ